MVQRASGAAAEVRQSSMAKTARRAAGMAAGVAAGFGWTSLATEVGGRAEENEGGWRATGHFTSHKGGDAN